MPDAEVLFEKRGAAGLITLNRPKALNALTRDMALAMKEQLDAWAGDAQVKTVIVQGAGDRAFCAGGDIRSLYESGRAGTPYALDFYRDEYLLDAAIKHYPKPYVALICGIVMGGGVGVSVHGSHRVADETTTFAMPETGIGLFPDVGGSFFLPRCPGEVGMYLALTGARLKTADCLYAGIATHFVAKDKRAALVDRLADGMTPDAALADLHESVPGTFLDSHRKSIDAIFGESSVDELLAALDAEHTDWSRDTAKTIRAKSPTSTKLTFRQLREGAALSFDECMRMEYRMVHRIVGGHDFYEGVRATIIDKDGTPRWRPAALEEVTDADIAAYFASLPEDFEAGGLLFPTVLELDADGWKSASDFYRDLLSAVGAPRWHGTGIDALIDSMVHGGINTIEAPYTVRIANLSRAPIEVGQEVANAIAAIAQAQGERGDIQFEIRP